MNNDKIKEFFQKNGVEIYGFGKFSSYEKDTPFLPKDVRDRYPFVISFGLKLSKGVLETIKDGPNPLYLHHYRQLNYRLDILAYLLAEFIEKSGFKAIPFPASQVLDWEKQLAHVSHKHIGVICGIGWIGKNNLLVHPKHGSQVRYITVITDMPLETTKTIREFSCASCRRCISVCPVHAIKEDPSEFDHISCFEMLKIFRKERNIGHFICGLCVKVCGGK